jgi:hypothetical protein
MMPYSLRLGVALPCTAAILVLVSACDGTTDGPPDSGAAVDAGSSAPAPDAGGAADAGTPDAGGSSDAGVDAGPPPVESLSIVTPLDGAVLTAGAEITVEVAGGEPAELEILIDGTAVATVSAPFRYFWRVDDFAEGIGSMKHLPTAGGGLT